MRPWLLVWMALLLSGCADVEQALVWLDDGRIAWRWRASPTQPHTLDVASLMATVAPPGQQVVRAWTHTEHGRTWHVVQARLDGPSAWLGFRAELMARVEAIVGSIPAGWAPAMLTRDGDAWVVDVGTDVPPSGTRTLLVQAPRMTAHTGREATNGAVVFAGDTVARATISDPRPHPLGFLVTGGPALACALAGMGLLMWVNRRTSRRLRARQS